ncbi:hypothetical protein AALP_AAs51417U000100, partial [Arabis alpina]
WSVFQPIPRSAHGLTVDLQTIELYQGSSPSLFSGRTSRGLQRFRQSTSHARLSPPYLLQKSSYLLALSCLNGLFPTDMELAQFTSDVETLLGGGTEREFHTMEELGLDETLKTEQEEEEEMATREVCDLDDADETAPFEISFDYEYSHKTTFDEEEDEKEDVMDVGVNEMSGRIKEEKKEKALMLRLDYEAVISTWGGQGTPWAAREPPKIDIDMVCFPTNST